LGSREDTGLAPNLPVNDRAGSPVQRAVDQVHIADLCPLAQIEAPVDNRGATIDPAGDSGIAVNHPERTPYRAVDRGVLVDDKGVRGGFTRPDPQRAVVADNNISNCL